MSLITASIHGYQLRLDVEKFHKAVITKLSEDKQQLNGVSKEQIDEKFAELASTVKFTLDEIKQFATNPDDDETEVNGALEVNNFTQEAINAINNTVGDGTKDIFFAHEALKAAGIISNTPPAKTGEEPAKADAAANTGPHWGWSAGLGVVSALLLLIGGTKWEESFGKGAVLLGIVGGVATALWAGLWNYIAGFFKNDGQPQTPPAEQPATS